MERERVIQTSVREMLDNITQGLEQMESRLEQMESRLQRLESPPPPTPENQRKRQDARRRLTFQRITPSSLQNVQHPRAQFPLKRTYNSEPCPPRRATSARRVCRKCIYGIHPF
ncbi:Hypothetical predicted protein [Scomber scombrus]|uniref:Uncharacterized protein n=1 Tax=Scomber scombrus TaxID=13677 RepID=A0AAV1NRJ4_SCOSC